MCGLQVAFYDGGAICFQDTVAVEPIQTTSIEAAILPSFFTLARRSIEWLTAAVHRLYRSRPPCVFGKLKISGEFNTVADLARSAERENPLCLESPFEGCDSIAGGLWSGRGVLGLDTDDALARLRFEAGTIELPIHVHEHSDRFIVVEGGRGVFHYADASLMTFDGTQVSSVPVAAGDVILFLRHVLHTFSAASEPLKLLSYHAPQINFDDPRQYTLPKFLWFPSHRSDAEGSQHYYHSPGIFIP